MDGYAIDTHVDPFAIRIFLDDEAPGADVSVSIIFMPLRSGKDGQIQVFPSSDIFVHHSVRNPAGWNFRILFGVFSPRLNEFHFGGFDGQSQSQSDTARRRECIRQDAKSLWITFYFIEQESGQLHSSLKLIDNDSQLDVAVDSASFSQFTCGFHQRDPITKILNSHFIAPNRRYGFKTFSMRLTMAKASDEAFRNSAGSNGSKEVPAFFAAARNSSSAKTFRMASTRAETFSLGRPGGAYKPAIVSK